MPVFMSQPAQQVWRDLAPLLLQLGTLSLADGVALEALCNQIVYMRIAQESIDRDGILIETKNGPRKNPAMNVADGTLKQIRALLGEFGLTPASRTRIQSNNPEAATALEQILGERTRLRTYGDA